MYILSFMYPNDMPPNERGVTFNLDHFLKVHLPLGIGLTQKYLGLKPVKILVFAPTRGGDGQPETAPYGAISSVFFETPEQVNKFATLFDYQEAAERLSADFANYTAHPPQIQLAETIELTDMDGLIHMFQNENK